MASCLRAPGVGDPIAFHNVPLRQPGRSLSFLPAHAGEYAVQVEEARKANDGREVGWPHSTAESG